MTAAVPDASRPPVDIQELLGQAWRQFAQEPATYIIAGLLVTAGAVITCGILLAPLVAGLVQMINRHAHGETIRAGDILEGLRVFGAAFLAFLIVAVGVSIGILAAVLPGVIIAFLWSHALFFVALRQHDAAEALKASWTLGRDHVGSVLLVILSVVALNSLGILAVIGWIITAPLSLILMTLSFNELTG